MKAKINITLGSLFDGIGGFPYAGSYFGIKPVWASEILPQAIAVTMRHFPDMKHVGDITHLSGAKLPPVDIISFGSPCQDLSMAGKRAGLEGERSSLFYEAIRIIDEMRDETNGKYPKYAVWENVPGALSSGNPRGSDFCSVLKAFTKTEIPIPDSRRWANAGMVRSNRVNLAWVTRDAQYHGVPQRRRRIFLVASFGEGRAEEVLFIEKGLRRNIATNRQAGQGTATNVKRCAGSPMHYGSLTPWDVQSQCIYNKTSIWCALCGGEGVHGYASTKCGNSSCKPLTEPAGVHQSQTGSINISKTAYALTTSSNASSRNAPLVLHKEPAIETVSDIHPDIAGTLCASGAGMSRPAGMASEPDFCVAYKRLTYNNYCQKTTPLFYQPRCNTSKEDNIADTQSTRQCKEQSVVVSPMESKSVSGVDCRNLTETGDISGTLQAKNTPGYSLNYQNPVRTDYIVRRLTPMECERLQGFKCGWTAYGHDNKKISDTRRYQMLGNSVAIPCVVYVLGGIVEQIFQED